MSTSPQALLMEIFNRLYASYGPQHWWPADEPFEVMVGAILTQSTAWPNVAKAIANVKGSKAMSPQALRLISDESLAALIRPSGYYNVKTRKLKALAAWIGDLGDNLETIFAQGTDQLRGQLLNVYGVGEETADSILLYAAAKPVFVIDAYTKRILDRIGIKCDGAKYADYQTLFMNYLPVDQTMYNEYHALIVEHGKITCRKSPRCNSCCILDLCSYGMSTYHNLRRQV